VDGSNNVTPTLVSALECQGDGSGMQNLWAGARPTQLPPPTSGFGPWYYVNSNNAGQGGSADGGRCIYTQPTLSNPQNSAGLVDGLKKAASKFTTTTCNPTCSSTAENIYDPASTSQKFTIWITMPIGTTAPDPNCVP
jgi:hypothetical protein